VTGPPISTSEALKAVFWIVTAVQSHERPYQAQKLDSLFGLFNRTDPTGGRYLARLVLSEMRIGVGEGTVRDAIADTFDVPVQAMLRRFRRKHDVAKAKGDVTLRFHAFDCLHAAGEDLLDRPLHERHDRLDAVLDTDATVRRSAITESDDADEIQQVEATALDAGHEGVMLKNPESAYSPGKRGQNWLKRKPDVETLDCVVTGAEWGEGRRANLLGSFELSVPAAEGYVTLGNVATEFTDEQLGELTALVEPHVRTQAGRTVDIEPTVVFEVGNEEIQTSPTYTSGYALRFPRFLGVRDDKEPSDADSLARLEELADGQG
jgi:DNA ligase-1